jgi:hypothetical protein
MVASHKPACINKPYEFVLTIKIPDTVSSQGFNSWTELSAKIATTGAVTESYLLVLTYIVQSTGLRVS